MKIVLADSSFDIAKGVFTLGTSCPFLMSFWYLGNKRGMKFLYKIGRNKKNVDSFYMDSGVFTARKHGIVIDVYSLICFYKKFSHLFDYVFTMDEGSSEVQLKNSIIMKKHGVPVIPIYHGTMPFDYFDRFAEITDYIAIGFYAVHELKMYENDTVFLEGIFEYLYRRNLFPIKIHALGTEQKKLLTKFPFYSADSAGYMANYAYVETVRFNKRTAVIESRMVRKSPANALCLTKDFMNYLENKKENRLFRAMEAVKAREDYQKFLTDLWEKRGIVWEDDCVEEKRKD